MRAGRRRMSYWLWVLAVVALALPAQPIVMASASTKGAAALAAVSVKALAAVATTPSVTLQVRSARDSLAYSKDGNPTAAQKLDPIPDLRKAVQGTADLKPNAPKDYKWLINLDNTGNTGGGKDDPACHPSSNPNYPTGCSWPSIRYGVASPAISEGTYADWNMMTALPAYVTDATGASGLPDSCDPTTGNPVPHATGSPTGPVGTVACRYLVSVTANGYQIGGAHFSVPMAAPGVVNVFLNPFPIPLGTMRLVAFNDNKSTNGQFDHLTEKGLEGFLGVVFDVDGILQADFYGNPLCTVYETNKTAGPHFGEIVVDSYGKPRPAPAKDPAPRTAAGYYNPTVPGRCLSDSNGDITIPNLAPNHYSARVTPPDFDASANPALDNAAYHWLQTTTLEGNHDHDVWVMPNDTGFDTELVVGGESVPFVDFGFVAATPVPTSWACLAPVQPPVQVPPLPPIPGKIGDPGCGVIKGQLYEASSYIPGTNGIAAGGTAGTAGLKVQKPIDRGWVALNNLNASNGDMDGMVATIPADKDGYFTFTNVPDGDYSATIWDEPQDHILDNFSVTVNHGQLVDMGVVPILGWFSHIFGHVFIDTNGNGRQDPGEPGLFHAFVQNLNRTNNTMVGGIAATYTDNNGFYDFTEAYPLGLMAINQFFNTRFKTTGVTWQACNDPHEHSVVAPMVDVSYLPVIGQCGRLDWGVIPYSPSANGDNGGIVATMIYDQTRQKYNARQAQTGDFQTGIPGFRFEQYSPVKAAAGALADPLTGYALNPDGSYQTTIPLTAPDGQDCSSMPATGGPLCYVSENNAAPAKCYPRDGNGTPQGYDPNNPRSFDFVTYGGACVESAAGGTQFGLGTDNTTHPVQTVDGNYTLGNGNVIPALNLGDTLVRAVVPVDHVLGPCPQIVNPLQAQPAGCDLAQVGLPRKLYTYTKEEDVNLFSGAQYVPQGANTSNLPWPPKAHYFAGTLATGVTATTLTDATVAADPTKVWTPGAFVGDIVKMGGVTATITANTETTVTFAKWSGLTPALGSYTIRTQEIIPGNYDENKFTYAPGIDPICAGGTHTVQVTNTDLLANGGSPFEGQTRHSCDMKLLNVQAGQSIAPNFHVRTAIDIPLPTHFSGLIIDDVSVDTNRKSTGIGEVHGIGGAPVGVYDWTGKRDGNVTADYNGVWDILMPSEDINNCPVPAGTCPNVYRFVGNDPGQPAAPNLNYDPNYKTITANFEAWPNMLVPADTAPSRVITNINAPGLQFTSTSPCGIKVLQPQLFAVGPDPFTSADAPAKITILGANFGTKGHVEFAPSNGDAPVVLGSAGPWTDHQADVLIGKQVVPTGPGMLTVVNESTVPATRSTSGLTFHVFGGGYTPHLIKVGPGMQFDPFAVDAKGRLLHPHAIQDALNLAATEWQAYGVANVSTTDPLKSVNAIANRPQEQYLIVVYPKWSTNMDLNQPFVPLGTYFENVIVHSPVKLQGVGPGGSYADAAGNPVAIQGSIIDGRYFNLVTANTDIAPTPDPATDVTEPAILHWTALVDSIAGSAHGTGFLPVGITEPHWTGQQDPLGEAAVITVVGTKGTYASGYKAAVDGFTISGGDQRDFPGNVNQLGGGPTTGTAGTAGGVNGQPVGAVNTQGGAIYLNGGTDNFQITNNLIRQNSGSYGVVRLGTPLHGNAGTNGGSSHNYKTAISHNQIAFNGGTNLAGAVGIFSDSNGYSIDNNMFCMNAALEYGGAVSHFGLSPNGNISNNTMLLNSSVDEGGAIMVASEPAYRLVAGVQVPDPTGITEGTGAVSIHHNYLGVNMAQDDGGAIRLMGTTGSQGLAPITIYNNMITNNISSHEGGGISLTDAPVVNLVNNTFASNITTATAATSNGSPAAAGVSSGLNSQGLMDLLNSKYAGQSPDWMTTGLAAGPDPQKVWPGFSSPLIENDIFSDNRAGSWTPNGIARLGMPADASVINRWDVGSVDAAANLRVRNSLISSSPTAPTQTYADDGANKVYAIGTAYADPTPGFIAPYTVCHNDPPSAQEVGCLTIQIVQLRTYFRFRPAAIVSVDLPANGIGDYHLTNVGSPAHAMGLNPQDLTGGIVDCTGANAQDVLTDDIDCNPRPIAPALITAGAHEVTAAVPVVAPVVVAPVVPPVGAPVVPPVTPPVVVPAGPPAGAPVVNTPVIPAVVSPVTPVVGVGVLGGAVPGSGVRAVVAAPLAPGASNPGAQSGVAGSAPAATASNGSGPSAVTGSAPNFLNSVLAFERTPLHQGETGLAGLGLLSILLAALWLGLGARRRRQAVPVQSDNQNIEGGEQL